MQKTQYPIWKSGLWAVAILCYGLFTGILIAFSIRNGLIRSNTLAAVVELIPLTSILALASWQTTAPRRNMAGRILVVMAGILAVLLFSVCFAFFVGRVY